MSRRVIHVLRAKPWCALAPFETPQDAPPKRARGGQPGNRNAVKHGAYSAAAFRMRHWFSSLMGLVRRAVARAKALIQREELQYARRRVNRISRFVPGSRATPISCRLRREKIAMTRGTAQFPPLPCRERAGVRVQIE